MSLLDNEEDLINNNNELIHNFLKKNYIIDGSYTIKNDVVYVDGHVFVKNRLIKSLTDGLFSFGIVDGYFDCSWCSLLKTLKGAPEKVNKNFDCSYCDLLVSLKGAPKEVGEEFDCSYCDSLVSLKGASKKVGKNFRCVDCKSLTTLEGAPKEVGGISIILTVNH